VKHSKLVYSIKLCYIVYIDLKTAHFSIAYYEYGEFATIISDFIQINICAKMVNICVKTLYNF